MPRQGECRGGKRLGIHDAIAVVDADAELIFLRGCEATVIASPTIDPAADHCVGQFFLVAELTQAAQNGFSRATASIRDFDFAVHDFAGHGAAQVDDCECLSRHGYHSHSDSLGSQLASRRLT